MDNTPVPPDSLHASFLRSLKLTVNPADPNPSAPTPAPIPDTGVDVLSTTDFSQKSGSLSDVMANLERDVINPPTPAVVPPVTPPVEPPVAATVPPVTPVVPPAVVPAVQPAEPQRVKIHELPKAFLEDTILPPPPSGYDMSGLDEDEQEEVQTALFAESRYPQKYAGHARRVLDFLRKHKQFVANKESTGQFDADEADYQRFLKDNRPNITNPERKRLDRERLLEEAAQAAEKRLSTKTKKLEEEVLQLKATPLVERTLNDYKNLLKELMPKEDDPIVVEQVGNMTGKAVGAAHEFLQLSASLKPYDSANETHKWLGEFIQEQGDLYVASKHESLKRGSKSFVPRAKFNSMPAADRAKHWTFTDEDVLQLIAVNAKAAAEYHSTNEKERLKKAGYSRNITPPPPAATPPPVPAQEPSARATPTMVGNAPISNTNNQDPFQRWFTGK